jgi:tRNA 2-thiocytidine biosynthesis protein TtcA
MPRPRGSFRFASKLERRIVGRVGEAAADHRLLEDGDHLLAAVSGGKDSLSMIEILRVLGQRSPVRFRMTVVTVHPGYAGFSTEGLERHYAARGFEHRVVAAPIAEILDAKLAPGTTPCSLCSRIRRGVLYTLAPTLGCNKIALGHHLDDLLETLLMNLFYTGQLRSMAPRLLSDDGRNVVIRPLCYVPEAWLAAYAAEQRLPVVACASPGCGGVDSTRMQVKRLITELDARVWGLRGNMLRALQNVRAEHLLDRDLLGALAGWRHTRRT